MKVFCVFSGDYSDRALVAVFSEKGKADAYQDARNLDDCQEIEVDSEPIAAPGTKAWQVKVIIETGDVVECRKTDIEPPQFFPQKGGWFQMAEGLQAKTDILVLGVICWARNEAHAVKVASEKRFEWITSPEGVSWVASQRPTPPQVDETSPERRGFWKGVANESRPGTPEDNN